MNQTEAQSEVNWLKEQMSVSAPMLRGMGTLKVIHARIAQQALDARCVQATQALANQGQSNNFLGEAKPRRCSGPCGQAATFPAVDDHGGSPGSTRWYAS